MLTNNKGWRVSLVRTVMAAVFGLALAFSPMTSMAKKSKGGFNNQQQEQIKKIVKDYLIANPEILLEVSKALQKKQQQKMVQEASQAIEANSSQLFSAKSPSVGNDKGKVTLVEFFDYQCIHCKNMAPVISKLVSQDKNLRVIYKDFPIFGKSSNFAAKAALAAKIQGKYKAFHDALLAKKQRLSPSLILKVADQAGLNTTKLKADMKSDAVNKALQENMALAQALRLMGTPAFVIAATPNGEFKAGNRVFFIPGAASEESLQNLINQASR